MKEPERRSRKITKKKTDQARKGVTARGSSPSPKEEGRWGENWGTRGQARSGKNHKQDGTSLGASRKRQYEKSKNYGGS